MGPVFKFRSNWNLEVLLFMEGGKPGEPGKKPSEKARTNNKLNRIHSDEGLKLETTVFEFFTVANLPY